MAPLSLALHSWGDIAQIVVAILAVFALPPAVGQLWLIRSANRRARVYDYADRFNQPQTLRAGAEYKKFWSEHTYDEFLAMDETERLQLNMLPNLIEEVAWLYNRNHLDRNVAAELLGVYVERLWTVSVDNVTERRRRKNEPSLFSEWEEMQRDTPDRQARAFRKAERRRARRRLLHGG